MKIQLATLVAAVAVTSAASAATLFSDDFESDAVSNPAVMANWAWNGVGDGGSDSRIFATGNYGGTQLWIADASSAIAGTGIDSTTAIALAASSDYVFSANFVMETSVASRTGSGTFDLLVDGTSVVGGPVAFAATGDDSGGAGNDSYSEQTTTHNFSTTAAGNLVISIVWDGSPDGAFAGVDNVSVADVPEPGSLALLGLGGLALLRRRRA